MLNRLVVSAAIISVLGKATQQDFLPRPSAQVVCFVMLFNRCSCTRRVATLYRTQVVSMRVMMTKDKEPKCAGLALVRFQNRDHAARALERLPETKVRREE